MEYDGKADFFWYIENQAKFVEQYNGKVLVIRNREIVGAYANDDEAIHEARKKFRPGEFIIQLCEPGTDAYTIRNSRIGALL